MKKKILIISIIVLIILAGAVLFFSIPTEEPEETGNNNLETPLLFGKQDYRIEERGEERFLVIEKAGFSAKIPTDWRAETEGLSGAESSSWINLSSPDAEVFDILTKGCGISIAAGIGEEELVEIKEKIEVVKEGTMASIKGWENYSFEVVNINSYEALEWTAPEKPSLGQALGLAIPLEEGKLISIDTRFPAGYEEICKPIWEDFLNSIRIE